MTTPTNKIEEILKEFDDEFTIHVLETHSKMPSREGGESLGLSSGLLRCLPDNRDLVLAWLKEKLSQVDSEARREEREKNGCPPHNLIDYHQAGGWAASVPPPNKICTKCLLTITV